MTTRWCVQCVNRTHFWTVLGVFSVIFSSSPSSMLFAANREKKGWSTVFLYSLSWQPLWLASLICQTSTLHITVSNWFNITLKHGNTTSRNFLTLRVSSVHWWHGGKNSPQKNQNLPPDICYLHVQFVIISHQHFNLGLGHPWVTPSPYL